MSKQAAEHHHKAAEHHEHAARHHREAAAHHEEGNHEVRRTTRTPRRVTSIMQRIMLRKRRSCTSNITGTRRRRPGLSLFRNGRIREAGAVGQWT
jgi:hypothetical protein